MLYALYSRQMSGLSPPEFVELNCPQRCFCDREEFVELRWRDGRATEHCVSLTTVMHLMLEQMQQQPIGTLRLHARAAMHLDDPIGPGLVESVAPGDQPAIHCGLRGTQLGDGRAR